MPQPPNFLLGYGERLTEPIDVPPSGQPRPDPYTFEEARARLAPMLVAATAALDALPAEACPHDEAVGVLTLHPQYLAKTYHPSALLKAVGLEPVGSRPNRVQPEKWTRKTPPRESETTDVFVAGPRENFRRWSESLTNWSASTPGAKDLFKAESFHAPTVAERLRSIAPDEKPQLLEVVLHAPHYAQYILEAFHRYALSLGATPDEERRFYAGGLCFLPVLVPKETIPEIAKFAFLRVARSMPRLRALLRPPTRSARKKLAVALPRATSPLDSTIRVAVFDGGLPGRSQLAPWVHERPVPGVGPELAEYTEHGHAVTSSLLFGPISEDMGTLPQPYALVDHFRVLDESAELDPYELYDTLQRIQSALQSTEYDFVNLSIGPASPVEDDEVHAWTSVLDQILSSGRTLCTIAIGNSGELDRDSGNARILTPSDCVNALGVGACDCRQQTWTRAAYSAFGPGRSPGVIKPDCLAFGGSAKEPFWVLDQASAGRATGTEGTSFAAPASLRTAVAIRAHFGSVLGPLAIKALLIHASEDKKATPRTEIGWGKLPDSLESFVVCPEGSARIVYQGELSPGRYLRAHIPLPKEELTGSVTITATFTFATATDPQDPGNYTRGGLGVIFRPNADIRTPRPPKPGAPPKIPLHADPEPFFQVKEFYSTEQELRHDAHKWETTLHRTKTMRVRSKSGLRLKDPVFDIHYHARESGASTTAADKIRYALVITVRAPKNKDLYNQIVRRYRTQLQQLVPVIQIPIRA